MKEGEKKDKYNKEKEIKEKYNEINERKEKFNKEKKEMVEIKEKYIKRRRK